MISSGTKKHIKYWENWSKNDNLKTINHPHRKLILGYLKNLPWMSLLEVGCNQGANLVLAAFNFPGRFYAGADVNKQALETLDKSIRGVRTLNNRGDDIMMSDNSADIVLTDMTLMYVSPKDIDKYLKEVRRIARNYVILCELHTESWWNRLALRFNSGYHAHNYKKLLDKHGFKDVQFQKLTEKDWPGGEPQKTFGYLIIAYTSKKKY